MQRPAFREAKGERTGTPRDERTVTDADFFRAFDLTRRGLAPVRHALDRDDLAAAKVALLEYFRDRPRPRWFFDCRDGRRGKILSPWVRPDPGLRRADGLLRNRFRLLEGFVRDFGPGLKWRTREMRRLFIPGNAFKRAEFFFDLAAAYARTGRATYAAKFAQLLDRWRKDWPLVIDEEIGPGAWIFNRADGDKPMPTAFRLMHWISSLYGGIVFARQVPVATAFAMLKSLWFGAMQYRRFATCPYRPANHHLWERGTVPFILGLMFPEIPELAALAEQGRRVVAHHADRSFLPDGGYEERCANYTVVALRMFLMPLQLAALNRVSLLDRARQARVRRCVEQLAEMVLPDGSGPDIGDGPLPATKLVPFLAAAARFFRSRPAAEAVRRLRLRRHVDAADRAALRRLRPISLPLTVHYPDSGYFVARDAWSASASAMVLSVPGARLPNHGHDDALSLQLVVRGRPVVGTPATELKTAVNQDPLRGSAAEAHFMAMTSHNVVLPSCCPSDPRECLALRGGRRSAPTEAHWRTLAGGVRVAASCEGGMGITLSREVTFRYRMGWRVIDRVQGGRGRPCILRWHFEYGVDVAQKGGRLLAACQGARLVIRIAADGPTQNRLYRDTKWLANNLLRPGEPAPWVLDVVFGGSGDDQIETDFEIAGSHRR